MRTIHRLYAQLLGYFWLPCPICGRYFGGHEKVGTVTVNGKITCSRHHIHGELNNGNLEGTHITT